ncbi:MAG TPA: HD domain-containing phosphohydrolase [Gemmatimonadales bacterium]|nr:HD domain-containing phosphohydrolase [Gemmatimonadales bacterium]
MARCVMEHAGAAMTGEGMIEGGGDGRGLTEAHRVLVVDDQADVRRALSRALQSCGYVVEEASDGIEALTKWKLDIDLVLLDLEMPGMDGYEVAQRLRSDPGSRDLPIIMVTGRDAREDRLRAVEAGANDFIGKPFELPELKARAASLLRMKEATDAMKRARGELEQLVARRTADLRRALDESALAQRTTYAAHLDSIRRLAIAAEFRDHDTADHIERIGVFCEHIARHLRMTPSEVETIRYASPMHDVGKLGIPDAVLLKAGPLDDTERDMMKRHTTIGARILHGSPSTLLQMGEVIALTHHERWDGQGYPNGLKGDAIPIPGRICAVADVFDALTSDRVYRPAMPHRVVYQSMESERGAHFDPAVLSVLLDRRDEFEGIQQDMRSTQTQRRNGQ